MEVVWSLRAVAAVSVGYVLRNPGVYSVMLDIASDLGLAL